MGRIWDFLMRRKPLLFGLSLIFIVSAAFSSVYLRPTADPGPVNVPISMPDDEAITPTPELESDPTPEPELTPEVIADPEESEPESIVHVAVAPSPEEVVNLNKPTTVPRTSFGFTVPGNIVSFATLNQLAISRQRSDADAVETWHYIVSATTAALIFGGVMVCLARFLSKNMLS